MYGHFDKRLLDHIRNGRNDEAKKMLNRELARTFDDSAINATLLHHAAEHNNDKIARVLIDLGADVDQPGRYGKTPLMLAMALQKAASIKVLLNANARIDVVDGEDSSVLRMDLNWLFVESDSFDLLSRKLRANRTSDEVAQLLIKAKCNISHAATLRDLDVMECLLKRGVNVNSKDHMTGMTGLHVAVELKNVDMADWLAERGVDVDALDEMGCSALRNCVWKGDSAMLQLLLQRGADVDVKGHFNTISALCAAYMRIEECRTEGESEDYLVCAEILLQHGTSLNDPDELLKLLNSALNGTSDVAAKMLIARLTMLRPPFDHSILHKVNAKHMTKLMGLLEIYEPCQQVLGIQIFENRSLHDLLLESDDEMKKLVRKETFLQEVGRISCEYELKEKYTYYYNSMMRRVEKAKRIVELENDV